jgi:hypothetical protein
MSIGTSNYSVTQDPPDEIERERIIIKRKRVPIPGGAPCPVCARDRQDRHPDRPVVLMQRYRHPDNFVPPPFAPWYQFQWDMCSCGHIAHHKHLRRPTPNYRPQAPFLRAAARARREVTA